MLDGQLLDDRLLGLGYLAGLDWKQIDVLIYHPTITERAVTQPQSTATAWAAKGYAWRTQKIPGLEPPFWGFWQRVR